ncbi:hypothetical protein FA95DRAFT_1612634 [Auriscalpium vulgare]|uniref:Uncharacterized protein n=1 Tax=Auriscalpium vulgare TaxID=40419 RepID=A0ACB8R5E5_9AGAM|nr:hypothetical protein FA95DRAFT_1612634 [Auriscalpium vulgare]
MYTRSGILLVALFAASCAAAPVLGYHAHTRAEQPELSARDPFNVGDLIHLNSISAAVEKLDRTQRRGDEIAAHAGSGTTDRPAFAGRTFHLPSTLEANLLIAASKGDSAAQISSAVGAVI